MGVRAVITDTLSELVVALCKDYGRRREAVKEKRFSHRVTVEYKYMNYKILDAAREIAGEDAEIYIKEIGESTGYAKSELCDITSERIYKTKKSDVAFNIARRLHFLD